MLWLFDIIYSFVFHFLSCSLFHFQTGLNYCGFLFFLIFFLFSLFRFLCFCLRSFNRDFCSLLFANSIFCLRINFLFPYFLEFNIVWKVYSINSYNFSFFYCLDFYFVGGVLYSSKPLSFIQVGIKSYIF